ncbi:MAG: RNA-binding protein, partial [Caldiserica bacterium]|nr:RNA-binding protein [Caldisericota bacterium]
MFKDTLMYIVKQLVDKTDLVSINELVGEQNLTYEIKVDPTDLG